jgi:xanthine dehydrogenase YagR molybdenum-binding subunit
MQTSSKIGIGTALSRVDGIDKVTGAAHYSAEYAAEGLLYGVAVSSAIAKGKIISIDEKAARNVPGVVEIITHRNRPHIAWFDSNYQDQVAPPGSPFRALYNTEVHFSGQPLALVLAETFEAARYAASLVDISYEAEPHNVSFKTALDEKFLPSKTRNNFKAPKARGDAPTAFAAAPIKLDAEYHLATEHHNPMEMHATTVVWDGDGKITVYDKTQGSQNIQTYISNIFGFAADKVRVVNAYVGGAFGSGLRPQYQVYLAVLAAKALQRSVRVVMTRQQMFTHVHRPEAVYHVQLGADSNGKLTSIMGDATTSTSRFEDNMENIVIWGMMNYDCPNASGQYTIAPRDTYTSGDMRAPGAATGMTLFEIAIDEMAEAANLDPLDFRLLNYSDTEAMNGLRFTSKALREAFQQGAEAFGWSQRSATPRSMKEGSDLIGWGVASGIWDALFSKTTVRAKLTSNGHLEVATATSDIGTGTYTIMTQVAAGTLGLAPEQITARLGDSALPASPIEGGSWVAASTGAAVQMACLAIGAKLIEAAQSIPGGPLGAITAEEADFIEGNIVLKRDPTKRVSFIEAMRSANLPSIEAEETAVPQKGKEKKARNTHSAVFAEVKVDEDLNVVRVTRIVIGVAAGRIINPKTARSQIIGGVVMGIGMALHEETFADLRFGRFMNHNLSEYHVPAHTDIGDIEVIFVDEPDPEVTPIGVKGVGEIGIVGTAAAVANAIYHATGKRVRSLPITIDKLL